MQNSVNISDWFLYFRLMVTHKKECPYTLNFMQVMGICISPKINIIFNECFITQKFELRINKRLAITFLHTKAQRLALHNRLVIVTLMRTLKLYHIKSGIYRNYTYHSHFVMFVSLVSRFSYTLFEISGL